MIKEIHIVCSEDSNLNVDDLLALSKIFQEQNIDFYPYFGEQEFKSSFTDNKNLLLEYIVKKSDGVNIEQEKREFLENFHSCLQIMDVTSELIIIDPYFYAAGRSETIEDFEPRLNLFRDMISPVADELRNIKIVTDRSKGNNEFIRKFNELIQGMNQSIEIHDYYTVEIHDRFWLNPIRNKGLIIGTSLNGLFKKYCFFDSLTDEDSESLLSTLSDLCPNL